MKEKCLKAYENRDYQFKELVRFVEINENRSNNPIFNVMMIYNHEEMVDINEKEIRVEESLNLLNSSSYNLTFRILVAKERYSLKWNIVPIYFGTVIATGRCVSQALEAAKILEEENIHLVLCAGEGKRYSFLLRL